MNDDQLDRFILFIAREWSWRIKELICFKQILASASEYEKKTLARCGVLLLYAHWEGFIKKSSKFFLKCFVNKKIAQVPQFIIAAHLVKMREKLENKYSKYEFAYQIIKSISKNTAVCADVKDAIKTDSNLSSKVLRNIAEMIGVDFSKFDTRLNYIDLSFVAIRNQIAHGEGRPVLACDFVNLMDDVTDLINIFKDDLIDSAMFSNEFLNDGIAHDCLNIK